ncbi:transposase [Candidatus Vondammii sp. HM_W22]|uniref:transposase n=1 Tax=Candidatus Vondammii sp. HM_W22 TaxID=2687299 RepID=UPI00403DC806
MHHAKEVERWLSNRTVKRYLEVFFLPAYSPELNPDEYLNCDLKSMLHSGEAIRSLNDLKKRARSCMRTLQKKPERVKSYFNTAHIKARCLVRVFGLLNIKQ